MDYKIVGVIPSGRKHYMECLVPYLLREKRLFNRIDLWVNTKSEEDVKYIYDLEKDQRIFNVVDDKSSTHHWYKNAKTYQRYYKQAQDKDTVYVKIDDDIVWIQDGALRRLVNFRLACPKYLIVIANIVNNALCNQINFRNKMFDDAKNRPENIHDSFLKILENGNELEPYDFGVKVIDNYIHAPNHVWAWFGRDTKHWFNKGMDEKYLTTVATKELGRPVAYLGSALVSHYAYMSQHEPLNYHRPDILKRYKAIADAV